MWHSWQSVPLTLCPTTLRDDCIRCTFSFCGRNVIEGIPRVLGIDLQERPLTDFPEPHGLCVILGGSYAGGGSA